MQRFAYEDAIDWFQLAITDLASLAGSAEHRVDLLTSLSCAGNRAARCIALAGIEPSRPSRSPAVSAIRSVRLTWHSTCSAPAGHRSMRP